MNKNSVDKLIDYLTLNTDIDDVEIEIALEQLKNDKNDIRINQLRSEIGKLLYKRSLEVKNYIDIINCNKYDYYHRKIYGFYHLPFKDTNIEIEKKLFSILFNDSRILEYLDYLFLAFFSLLKIDDRKSIDNLRTFLFQEGINYNTYKSTIITPMNMYPDDKELYSNWNEYYDKYGEFLTCKIESLENPNTDVIWVSKYVGDGFGYDILSKKPIEVKTTINKNNRFRMELTSNEWKQFNTDINTYIYHFYLIDNENYELYRLHKESNYIIDDKNNIYVNYDSTQHFDLHNRPCKVLIKSS